MIREGCRINELVFEDLLNGVDPDMTEVEVEGLITSSIYKHGGEGPNFPVFVFAGEHSKNAMGRNTHEKLGKDRMIYVNFGAQFGGYGSSYGRPFLFGKMTAEMKSTLILCMTYISGCCTSGRIRAYCPEMCTKSSVTGLWTTGMACRLPAPPTGSACLKGSLPPSART